MPRMPDRLPSVRAPRGGGGVRMPGGDVSSGLREIGQTLDAIAADMRERRLRARDQDDAVALHAAQTRFRQTQTERLVREGDDLTDDAIDGFADRYEQGALTAAETEIAALPERVRPRAQIAFTDATSDLRLRAADVEHGRRVDRAGRLLDGVIRGEGAVVFADPTQYAEALQRSGAAVEGSVLGEAAQERVLAALPRTLANQRMMGLTDRAPLTAIRELEGGDWNGVMEVEEIARHLNDARREQARRVAEAERRQRALLEREGARLRVRMEDERASILETGRSTGLMASEVARVGGAEAADAFVAQRRDWEETHTRLSRWRFMPPGEIEADLARDAPRPGQEGFAAASERHAALVGAAGELIEARTRDPAAAALAADPALAQLYEALAEPGTNAPMRRVILAQMADRQTRLGIPGGLQRVTTNGQAASLAARIRDAGPAERARAIEEVSGQVSALFGERSGQALAEVARVAEMPELGAMAAVAGTDAVPREQARRTVARALAAPEPDLPQQQSRQIDAKLDTEFAGLAESAAGTPGGAARVETARNAARRVAAAAVAAGENPSEAAEAAARLYTAQFRFRAGLRIPRVWGRRELDAGAVVRGAAQRLREIETSGDFNLPAGDDRATPEQQARNAADSLGEGARWTSAPNDRGLILRDQYGAAILDREGREIAVGWDELIAAEERGRLEQLDQATILRLRQ